MGATIASTAGAAVGAAIGSSAGGAAAGAGASAGVGGGGAAGVLSMLGAAQFLAVGSEICAVVSAEKLSNLAGFVGAFRMFTFRCAIATFFCFGAP